MLSRATRSTAREAGEVAAVGAPVLTAPRIDRLRQIAPGWLLRTAEEAAKELQAASSSDAARPTTVLAGAAATEPAVREAIGRATVLHVAAPFRINAASPLFSSVLLTAPEAPPPARRQLLLAMRRLERRGRQRPSIPPTMVRSSCAK